MSSAGRFFGCPVKKKFKKSSNPVLREICGFTYRQTKSHFFGYRKPVFRIFLEQIFVFFCPLDIFFGAFLEAPRRVKKHEFFSSTLLWAP
jgi:hypothetical protein